MGLLSTYFQSGESAFFIFFFPTKKYYCSGDKLSVIFTFWVAFLVELLFKKQNKKCLKRSNSDFKSNQKYEGENFTTWEIFGRNG